MNIEHEKKLRIIAEPGRYYACSAFTLCVNVIAKRIMNQSELQQAQDKDALVHRQEKDFVYTSKTIMYYINDGVYASFNCLFYDHAECLPVLLKERQQFEPTLFKSSIWGPTCDGLDLVVKECLLPELDNGEFMVFKNMGAYTISGAVAFNGIPLARCIYIASTSWSTIQDAFIDYEIDEHFSIKESNTSTCAAAASFAFSRGLSSMQQEQQSQIRLNEEDQLSKQEMNMVNQHMNEENNMASLDQSEFAITC